MHIGNGIARHYRIGRVPGVLAISLHRLLGWPKLFRAYPPGIRTSVYLRLRTSDMKVYSDVLIGGEYGFDLPFAPKTIVDAGANIGMASIFFARRYPGAKIIAIEPEASNFSLLMRNVRAYSAIVPIHAALWNRDGQISVGDPDPETGAGGKWAFVTREGPGAKVRAVTMPTLMQEMGVRTIDLAKIDIEGAEQELFQDTKWLAGTECVMIGLHDRFRPGCSEVVNSAMQGFTRMHRSETDFYLRGTRSGIPH